MLPDRPWKGTSWLWTIGGRTNQNAEATIHRVAVCSGIPPAKIKSGQNENLLKVLTVALTLTAWLCTVLKKNLLHGSRGSSSSTM